MASSVQDKGQALKPGIVPDIGNYERPLNFFAKLIIAETYNLAKSTIWVQVSFV